MSPKKNYGFMGLLEIELVTVLWVYLFSLLMVWFGFFYLFLVF